MLKDFLRKTCNEQNIKTAAGLHDYLKRTNVKITYEVTNNLWKGFGKMQTLEAVLFELGVKEIKQGDL